MSNPNFTYVKREDRSVMLRTKTEWDPLIIEKFVTLCKIKVTA